MFHHFTACLHFIYCINCIACKSCPQIGTEWGRSKRPGVEAAREQYVNMTHVWQMLIMTSLTRYDSTEVFLKLYVINFTNFIKAFLMLFVLHIFIFLYLAKGPRIFQFSRKAQVTSLYSFAFILTFSWIRFWNCIDLCFFTSCFSRLLDCIRLLVRYNVIWHSRKNTESKNIFYYRTTNGVVVWMRMEVGVRMTSIRNVDVPM